MDPYQMQHPGGGTHNDRQCAGYWADVDGYDGFAGLGYSG
jgi:hypothetical protein